MSLFGSTLSSASPFAAKQGGLFGTTATVQPSTSTTPQDVEVSGRGGGEGVIAVLHKMNKLIVFDLYIFQSAE